MLEAVCVIIWISLTVLFGGYIIVERIIKIIVEKKYMLGLIECFRCGNETMRLERFSIETSRRNIGQSLTPQLYSRFICFTCDTEIILRNSLDEQTEQSIEDTLRKEAEWLEKLNKEKNS